MSEVVKLSDRVSENAPAAPPNAEPTTADLITLVERVDGGLRLAATALAQIDVRVRKLEIAERKCERKLAIIKPGEV